MKHHSGLFGFASAFPDWSSEESFSVSPAGFFNSGFCDDSSCLLVDVSSSRIFFASDGSGGVGDTGSAMGVLFKSRGLLPFFVSCHIKKPIIPAIKSPAAAHMANRNCVESVTRWTGFNLRPPVETSCEEEVDGCTCDGVLEAKNHIPHAGQETFVLN